MHSVLHIPELVTTVLDDLSRTSPVPTVDLLHAALVCRAWGELALDQLWANHQDGIIPLLRCFPSDIWKFHGRAVNFSRDPSLRDFSRYLANARRMTRLNLGASERRIAITENDFLLCGPILARILLRPLQSILHTFPKLRELLYHHRYHERTHLQSEVTRAGHSENLTRVWTHQAGEVAFPGGIEERVFLQLCTSSQLRSLCVVNAPGNQLVAPPRILPFSAPVTVLEVAGSPDFLVDFVLSIVRASSTSALQMATFRYISCTRASVTTEQLSALTAQIGGTYAHTLTDLSIHSENTNPYHNGSPSTVDLAAILLPLRELVCLTSLEIGPPFGSVPLNASFVAKIPVFWPKLIKLSIDHIDLPDVGRGFQGMNFPDLLGVVELAVALPQLRILNIPFICVTDRLPNLPPGRNLCLKYLGAAYGEIEGTHEILRVSDFIALAFPRFLSLHWINVGYQWSAVQCIIRRRILLEQRRAQLEMVASALHNAAPMVALYHDSAPEFRIQKRTMDALRSFRGLPAPV
ncbi:hypothetical protein DXG01_004578 [Tephrocybe rancida]|nr:hypothetical protein DXG01_004578 [Tephrocybe rancida]